MFNHTITECCMYNRCFQCLNELAIVSPFKFVDRASYLTFLRVNWVILASVNQYRLSFTVDKCFLARYLIPTRTKESVYVWSTQTRLAYNRKCLCMVHSDKARVQQKVFMCGPLRQGSRTIESVYVWSTKTRLAYNRKRLCVVH